MDVTTTGVASFFASARERYHIKLRRDCGLTPPWSEDTVFQQFRFCNVHREDDKTTVWFRENIRSRLSGLAVVEATVFFRWFNRIEVGEIVKDMLINGWNSKEARRRLKNVHPVSPGAYMLKTPAGYNKLEGILECIEASRIHLPSILNCTSLQQAWQELLHVEYLGRFLAYEIVSDLRWTPVLFLATDIMTWASAGPGCTRGLGRVSSGNAHEFNYGSNADQTRMLEMMQQLLAASKNSKFWPQEWRAWEMREVEHWSCEYDKYERAYEGGRMKRRFTW